MKIKLFLLLLLSINSFYSQNSLKLITERESLKNKKLELLDQISEIDIRIEFLNSNIEFEILKEKSTIAIARRNSSFYKTPNQTSEIIENIKINDIIYLIEHDSYTKYYKVIYNDKIGFIKEKDIKETKETKRLNTLGAYDTKLDNKSSLSKSNNSIKKKS